MRSRSPCLPFFWRGTLMPRDKRSDDTDDRVLRLRAGETLEFPVDPDDPLAAFQTLQRVYEPVDVDASGFKLPAESQHEVMQRLGQRMIATGVLQLDLDHIEIPRDATLRVNYPFVRINADHLHLTGSIETLG